MNGSANGRARIAAALFGFALAEVAIGATAAVLSGLSPSRLVYFLVPSNLTLGFALAVAGAPIARYRPGNRVGWLLLGGGCAWASTGTGVALLACAARADWDGWGWRLLVTVTNGGWTWALTFFLPLALLLFPDGRLPGPRWRWLVVVAAVTGPLFCYVGMSSVFSDELGIAGLLTLPPERQQVSNMLGALGALLNTVTYLGVAVAIVLRYRRAGERVRRQLLWVVLATLVVVLLSAVSAALPDSALTIYPIALIPLAILVAIFRYQLFDIRLVFARSLVYLLLTALAVGAYLALVGVLGQVLSARIADGPAVVATLVVALAFNPVRVWLQRGVDRAVYGARRDPVRALAEVGARLGDVGAGDGLDAVLGTLCRVLRLPSAALVYRGEQVAGYGQPTGVLHATPIHLHDERVGELIVGVRSGDARLDAGDERVLGLLAAPIAVAVHATALATELGRSREQVISGREEERRRLRRDLHDGLGPLLTGVVLNAEAALRLVRTDPERSAELLGELRNQTTGALEDIRRLVYELRPPALDSLGLVEALREYAVVLSRRADATPLRVVVEAEPLGELPAAVEVAAYRIATEALTNVTRHSSAGSAVVRLTVVDGQLRVAVHDDGVNVAAGWQPGVGLTSIRERAAELGGSCSIQLDRTGGRVDVTLPLPARSVAWSAAGRTVPAAGSAGESAAVRTVPAGGAAAQ
jgi:signal transduction histidine kinase